MNKETYDSMCIILYNEIIRLYNIHCYRCVRARVIRLAQYDTEFYGNDYSENLQRRKSQFREYLNNNIAGE